MLTFIVIYSDKWRKILYTSKQKADRKAVGPLSFFNYRARVCSVVFKHFYGIFVYLLA